MQRLALMMAVMMLMLMLMLMMMFPPSAWFGNSGEALATEIKISSATLDGSPPVEPGGLLVGRILQRVQQGVEGLAKTKDEVRRVGQEATRRNPGGRKWKPGSGESGQDSRPKREAAQKAMDALKKGADATRGRGRRKGRMYQRAGVRN
jgi:hypothetical protein